MMTLILPFKKYLWFLVLRLDSGLTSHLFGIFISQNLIWSYIFNLAYLFNNQCVKYVFYRFELRLTFKKDTVLPPVLPNKILTMQIASVKLLFFKYLQMFNKLIVIPII